jgi:serine protease Do
MGSQNRRPMPQEMATMSCLFNAPASWKTWALALAGAASLLGPNTASAQQSLMASHLTAIDEQMKSGNSVLHLGSDVLSRIAEKSMPSVVHIQCERPGQRGGLIEETGSGVVMSHPKAAGYFVVTNRHVIQGAELNKIQLILSDSRTINPVSVLTDEKSDLAVLRLPINDVTPASWGESDTVNIGHMVLAMGSPFGLSQSVTFGIISAKGRRSLKLGQTSAVINQDFLQTDAAINPGNSGGPLIDLAGNVVGINTAIASSSGGNEGIGFSIPSNLAQFVVGQLIENGKVDRAYLGVKLDPNFTMETARRLRLDRVRGARVMEIYANTPASRSNLAVDDVVLAFNNTEIKDENHLINLVSLTPVSSEIKLTVFRAGRRINIAVLLADRSELESRAEAPTYQLPGQQNRVSPSKAVEPSSFSLHALDGDLIKQLSWTGAGRGCVVLDVSNTQSMLAPCDILLEIAGEVVANPEDVSAVLARHHGAQSLFVKYARLQNGEWQTKAAVLKREQLQRSEVIVMDTDA